MVGMVIANEGDEHVQSSELDAFNDNHNEGHHNDHHNGFKDTCKVTPVDSDSMLEKNNGKGPSGSETEDEENEACGWGKIQPICCQRFRNPKVVLFWLCWAGAIQGLIVNGFVPSVISSLEKRFDMASTETGIIASGYDIASVLCLIPVSYFGGIGRKPRWIGLGLLVMGLGALIFSLPHFTTGLYVFESAFENKCYRDMASNQTACNVNHAQSSLASYKYMFILAQLFHGAGAAPLYTLGVTFLDENLKPKMTSLYVGIFYALTIVGPAVGYLLGGVFLNFYVDSGAVDMDTIGIDPYHPLWVGAWWIGFIFSGTLALIVGCIFLGFPKFLPGHAKLQEERVSEAYKGGDDAMSTMGFGKLKDIPGSLKMLLTNPAFIFLNLAGASEGMLLSGFSAFAPKFVEAQFSLTSNWASQYVGYAVIPAGGGGTFLGGFIVMKMNLKCKGIIRLCIIATALSLVSCLCFLIRCPNIPFVGVNKAYTNGSQFSSIELDSSCNSDCKCSAEDYAPVCGTNGLVYFSPCHAGCQTVITEDGTKYFGNCSCIEDYGIDYNASTFDATDGTCQSDCNMLAMFLPFFACTILFTFLASMPALTATLRCVPAKQKSFALGIQWIMIRCLGTIPAPILFGKLLDLTCSLWQQMCDGTAGSCYVYSNFEMGRNFMILGLCGKVVSMIFFILAYFLYKAPPKTSSTDQQRVKHPNNGVDDGYLNASTVPTSTETTEL